MRPPHWFAPKSPDVLGMLAAQAELTLASVEALLAWAEGDAGAADRLRDIGHRADEGKRALRIALTEAFVTPLEPEDVFELSRGLDEVVNSAKNAVREADLMRAGPDGAIATMAGCLVEGTRHLLVAFAALAKGGDGAATDAADAAVASERGLERAYRAAMSALIDLDDGRELAVRRELYRRLARTGDMVVVVAERVWYAVLKLR